MKKILIYPAIFTKEDTGYSVYVPDFDNSTCGSDLAEAIYMAKDLIGSLAVFYTEDEKKDLPLATKLTDIKLENKDDFCSLVEVDYEAYKKSLVKSVKKTVYIPKDLNDMAEELDLNFSKILREALKKELKLY